MREKYQQSTEAASPVEAPSKIDLFDASLDAAVSAGLDAGPFTQRLSATLDPATEGRPTPRAGQTGGHGDRGDGGDDAGDAPTDGSDRAHRSAVDHRLHTAGVAGSNPAAPTPLPTNRLHPSLPAFVETQSAAIWRDLASVPVPRFVARRIEESIDDARRWSTTLWREWVLEFLGTARRWADREIEWHRTGHPVTALDREEDAATVCRTCGGTGFACEPSCVHAGGHPLCADCTGTGRDLGADDQADAPVDRGLQ